MPTLFQKDCAIPARLTVAFLGDSITNDGTYIAFMDAYFKRHMPDRDIRFINLGVSSETAAGTSEPAHPFPRPCVHDRLDAALRAAQPDWVVLCYGMNDGIYYPFGEERFAAYHSGILQAVAKVRAAGCRAIVMTPPPFDAVSMDGAALQPEGMPAYAYNAPYRGYDETMQRYADWLVGLGDQVDGIVDIHAPLAAATAQRRSADPHYRSGDGIHPNAYGHWIIARTLLGRLFNVTLDRVPDEVEGTDDTGLFPLVLERHRLLGAAWKEHVGHTNPNKEAALPLEEALARGRELDARIAEQRERLGDAATRLEKTSDWNGYAKVIFYVDGREGVLIRPEHPAEGNPWVWRAEFLHAFDQADQELLRQGWHIAYCRLSNMFGCPFAVAAMRRFKRYVTDAYALAPRAALFGFSRGGLYATNYAAAYPDDVASLYLDAPVLDILSWPAGRGEGAGSPAEWESCRAVYGLTEESADAFDRNPLDAVDALAATGIPIVLVAGDADSVVPYRENGERLAGMYAARGGTIETYVKPGVGHHPHSLDDPAPIVSFVQRHSMR